MIHVASPVVPSSDDMASNDDRFLDAHPELGPLWYRALTLVVGRALTVPGLRRWEPLARRVHAVTKASEHITVLDGALTDRAAPATEITVLCANLWHDWPRGRRIRERLESFAQLAESVGADIVLLQEAARTGTLQADRWLAERLGLAMTSARANGDVEAVGFEEGPAILSRFPLGEVQLRQLSHGSNPLVRRLAIAAHLDAPHGSLLVVSVHLGLRQRHNAGQIRRLRSWVAGLSGGDAAIIGGDFNAPEHMPEIARTGEAWTDTFRLAHPDADATTHSRSRPFSAVLHRRLDYIFVQQPTTSAQWCVLECRHLDAPDGPHSDHRAVLARLAPSPSTSPTES
jgi:endonuclease/exonuclease/phosphatase family metal-dependent hydrolase